MTAAALEVTRLSKSFGGIAAIADVSFRVKKTPLVLAVSPT